jgi:ribosomal protein L22
MKTTQKEAKSVKNPTRIIKTAPLAISSRKMNLVAGLIRRQELEHSLNILEFLAANYVKHTHDLPTKCSKKVFEEHYPKELEGPENVVTSFKTGREACE